MKRKLYVFSGIAAALIALGCGTASTGNDSAITDGGNSPIVTPTRTDYPKLTTNDITLKVKVVEKQCFGEAGCNLSWKVQATVDATRLRSGVDWDVTYEVSGVQDGPYIGTLTMYGDGTYLVDTDFGQTPSKDSKLTVKVTDIDKVGL